ncbi:MAG: primosomal protein N' [Candidatus Schekmanbacteria bacterium]|nr:primosomal protein N' [Candidatus Schekmanbacteria bacterium]
MTTAPLVEVVVPGRVAKTYTYRVAAADAGRLAEDLWGWRVLVPFGRKQATGYVCGLAAAAPPGEIKEIERFLDPEPVLTKDLWELVRWVSLYYACSLGIALRAALPGPLHRGEAGCDPRLTLVSVARLAARSAAADAAPGAGEVGKLTRAPQQQRLFEMIRSSGGAGLDLAPAASREAWIGRALRELVKRELVRVDTVKRRPAADQATAGVRGDRTATGIPELGEDQGRALAAIIARLESVERDAPERRLFLLQGVTGSGKTEVFMRAMAVCRQLGRQAIVLVPEISLTPALEAVFATRFPGDVAIVHSRLTERQRVASWWRIRRGEAGVVLGPRSAIFAPAPNVGLIVVDEEHDSSYKQDAAQPYYHARDLAAVRARVSGAVTVLVTATPALETTAASRREELTTVVLPCRVSARPLPAVSLIDLRKKAETPMATAHLSQPLRAAIAQRLECGEQTIVLANRRGYSPFVRCTSCGLVPQCGDCDVSLTYHRGESLLRCHYCGFSKAIMEHCPACEHGQLKTPGVAIEKIAQELRGLFPEARIERMDSDTVRGGVGHDEVLARLAAGDIQVLVGTQMVAKGHHYPEVTLVGVTLADLGLYLPDYRAAERTFQLLTQVAGRAGRGEKPGEVLIQTCHPEHYVISLAQAQNHAAFADRELALRERLRLPPYRRLALLTVRGRRLEEVSELAYEVAGILGELAVRAPDRERGFTVSGPFPAPLGRLRGLYRLHILVRAQWKTALGPRIGRVLRDHKMDRPSSRGQVLVDVDPVSVL